MNKKQFILALAACIILGVAYFVVNKEDSRKQNTSAGSRSELLSGFDPNVVEKFVLTTAKETLTLEKKENQWTLPQKHSYPADFRKLQRLMILLKDMKVAQTMKVGKSMFGKLRLLEKGDDKSQGDVLELMDKSGTAVVKMVVGKEHFPQKSADDNPMFGGPQPDGRYLFVEGTKQPVLVSNVLRDVDSDINNWIDRSFFAVTKIKSIKSSSTDGKDSWILTRKDEKSEFECLVTPAEGKEIDSSVITKVTSSFAGYSFEELKPKAELKLDGARSVTVKTFEDFTYELKIVKLDDGYYVLPAISAEIPKERTPAKDEKPEDKEKLEKEFKDMVAGREKVLENQVFFNDWAYKLPDAKAKELVRMQSEFLKDVEKKEEKKVEAKPAAK